MPLRMWWCVLACLRDSVNVRWQKSGNQPLEIARPLLARFNRISTVPTDVRNRQIGDLSVMKPSFRIYNPSIVYDTTTTL